MAKIKIADSIIIRVGGGIRSIPRKQLTNNDDHEAHQDTEVQADEVVDAEGVTVYDDAAVI